MKPILVLRLYHTFVEIRHPSLHVSHYDTYPFLPYLIGPIAELLALA